MSDTIVLILLVVAWAVGEYALLRAITTPTRYVLALRMALVIVIGFQVLQTFR